MAVERLGSRKKPAAPPSPSNSRRAAKAADNCTSSVPNHSTVSATPTDSQAARLRPKRSCSCTSDPHACVATGLSTDAPPASGGTSGTLPVCNTSAATPA